MFVFSKQINPIEVINNCNSSNQIISWEKFLFTSLYFQNIKMLQMTKSVYMLNEKWTMQRQLKIQIWLLHDK